MIRSFADSAHPERIPASYHRLAGYADGEFKWPAGSLAGHEHICLSVTGDLAMAAIARAIDVENFDATPDHAPGWIEARHDHGHDDATVYCSLEVVPDVLNAVKAIPAAWVLPWRLWVAWWRPAPPTRGLVRQALAGLGCGMLPLDRIWACQWQAVPDLYDVSVLYGRDDFSRPLLPAPAAAAVPDVDPLLEQLRTGRNADAPAGQVVELDRAGRPVVLASLAGDDGHAAGAAAAGGMPDR